MKILLGVSGGIAAYKTPDLVRRLQKAGFEVGAALTPSAARFVSPLVLRTLCDAAVMEDVFAHESAGIGHIDLADWADLVVVAPASAQTLARLAGGHADDPVSLSFLASAAPKLVFPAMNVNMWKAAPTRRNVETLRADGVTVVDPESGELACGWTGAGRLPDLDAIVAQCRSFVARGDLSGRRIVVTAGPTRERIDPVRFISNPSTGKMGFAVAGRAAARGAEVVLVAGPTELPTPPGVRRVDVVSAADMRDAALAAAAGATVDAIVAAAAVADYRPVHAGDRKQKKTRDDASMRTLEMERTPDVLLEFVQSVDPAVRVGFAAETHDMIEHAREKLARKRLSFVVANDVTAAAGGFADDRNRVWFVFPSGEPREIALAPKTAIADRILDEIVRLLPARTA